MKTYLLWVFGIGLALTMGAFSATTGMASSPQGGAAQATPDPTSSSGPIRIVSPRANGIVPIGQNKIEIATENAANGTPRVWNLYLDGNLISTIDNGDTTFTLPIGVSGPHVIKVTLTDGKNVDLGSASVQVTAAPETPSSSPFNLTWVAPTMAVFLIGVAALLVVSLRMTRNRGQVTVDK